MKRTAAQTGAPESQRLHQDAIFGRSARKTDLGHVRAKLDGGEAGFARTLVDAAKTFGWLVYFVHRSDHSPAGWPDIVALKGHHALFAELKSATGQPSAEQYECLMALREVTDITVRLWRPDDWDEAVAVLRGAGGAS